MSAQSPQPVLTVDTAPDDTRAVALVLHGGRSRSVAPVRANQLAVLRMKPFASSLSRAGARHGLAVARLRFAVRGWNGAERSPVADAEHALEQLRERFGDVPVGLVGHSMGGRTAMYAGGFPTVRSIVGLAPWIEPGDPFHHLAGRRILIVHGDGDRMTSAPESARYAADIASLAGGASSVTFVSVRGGSHAMLRRAGTWHDLATGFTLAALCDVPPEGTVGGESANIVVKALAGQTSAVV